MKIIDDIFVFTNVQSDKFFVCNGFSFYVFGPVCILESIDCFFKLTA